MSTTSNFRLKDNICQETLEPASPSRGQVWASDTDYGDRVRDLVLPLPELHHKHLTQALRICVSTRALSQGLLGPTLFFRDLFLIFEAGVRIYILRLKGTFIYPLITRRIYPYNTSLYQFYLDTFFYIYKLWLLLSYTFKECIIFLILVLI